MLWSPSYRVWHGYENTRGVLETGWADMGTVCKMLTCGHTTTCNRSIAGLYGYKVQKIFIIFYYFIYYFYYFIYYFIYHMGGKVNNYPTLYRFLVCAQTICQCLSGPLNFGTLAFSLPHSCRHTLSLSSLHSRCHCHRTLAVTAFSLRHVTSHLTPTPQARER